MGKSLIPYKWQLVIILWFAYFLNQGDRQIYNVVIPLLKEDLHISDIQAGLVVMIFTIVYGILVPVSGFLGDLMSRKAILFASIAIFSLGTLFTGMAGGVFLLVFFRSLATGAGEAFYFPAATSLLGQFHHKTRAMALSIHQTALYIGIVASGFISGYIGQHYGWRMSFYTFGFFGVICALVVLFKVENTPMPESSDGASKNPGFLEMLSAVCKKESFYLLSLAFACMCFVNVGFVTWMPTYLHEKFGMSLAAAGLNSTLYHFASAFAGVILGAKISDFFALKRKSARMETEFWGLLLGAPFIFLMGWTDSEYVCYASMAAFGFFRGIYDSNLFAALFDIVEPRFRATASGLYLSIAFVAGSFASVVLAVIKGNFGMQVGIMSLSAYFFAGAVFVLILIKFFFSKNFCSDSQTN